MRQNGSVIRTLIYLMKGICLFDPLKTALTLALMISGGLTNGVNIIMLVPLLQATGFGGAENADSYLSKSISKLFDVLGLSPSLGPILLVFLAVFLIMSFLSYYQVKLSSELSNEYSAYLRERLYKNLFNAQWLFFINKKMAYTANILTVEAQRIMIAYVALIRVTTEAFIAIMYIILAILISWQITVIVVLAGAVLSWFMKSQIQSGRSTGIKMTDTNNELQSAVWEHLGSAKIVKGYSSEKQSLALFHEQVSGLTKLNIRYLVDQARIKAIFEPVTVVLLCAGLYIALNYLKIDTAYLVVLLFIFYRISPKITLIQQNYHKTLTAMPAISALNELETEALASPEYSNSNIEINSFKKGAIIKNVAFCYQSGNRNVLEDINIYMPKGKTIALVGESGSGKSTIADLMLGLLIPTNGNILIDDVDMKDINMKSWRSLIGYVTQDTILFHDTVLSNLLWANPDASETDIVRALEIASAAEFVSNLSAGVNTIIGDRGMRLSGGQRQRLALARALLRKPKLLILDEATSSLDSESENKIMNAIETLHGSITILMISHRLATVRDADIIYLLDNGRVTGQGSWDELIGTDQGHFKKMCELQGLS